MRLLLDSKSSYNPAKGHNHKCSIFMQLSYDLQGHCSWLLNWLQESQRQQLDSRVQDMTSTMKQQAQQRSTAVANGYDWSVPCQDNSATLDGLQRTLQVRSTCLHLNCYLVIVEFCLCIPNVRFVFIYMSLMLRCRRMYQCTMF